VNAYREPPPASFVFDLDGTLVDSVYHHVTAWREALVEIGIDLAVWRIHRRIGMSGGLLVAGVLRETGRDLSEKDIARLKELHRERYAARRSDVRALPGARALLAALDTRGVRWSIATSGSPADAMPMLDILGLGHDVPMITSADVPRAKPDPHLFLAGAAKIGADPHDCIVVGDSVWDLLAARRAHAIGVGLLSGGYGVGELTRAQAFRVYDDPADLLEHLDELGVRTG
jgi:HAD superfamily hydrolase (TIGR01509 family)